MSIFDELLRLKELRESQAELGFKNAQSELNHARSEHEQQKAGLEIYVKNAREQELRRYADLFAKPVKLGEITELRDDLAKLREGERQRQASLDQAAIALSSAMDNCGEARLSLARARAAKGKFVELVSSVAQQEQLESQRKEDLEMMEVSEIGRDRCEGGQSNE